MKKQIVGLLLASALTFAATGCATYSHSAEWQYKVAIVGGNMYAAGHVPVAEETINSMAKEGWHLVSVSAAGDGPQVVLVFKKHK